MNEGAKLEPEDVRRCRSRAHELEGRLDNEGPDIGLYDEIQAWVRLAAAIEAELERKAEPVGEVAFSLGVEAMKNQRAAWIGKHGGGFSIDLSDELFDGEDHPLYLAPQADTMEREEVLALMEKVMDEHPLACVHNEDGRYTWPERWAALRNAILAKEADDDG